MSNGLAKILQSAYIKIYGSQDIRKLLYYSVDDFDEDVTTYNNIEDEVAVNYIKKVPSDYLIQQILDNNPSDTSIEEKRGFITVFAEDFDRMDNPYGTSLYFRIEIYMPIRGFEEYQFRMATISDIIRDMFIQKEIEGSFGRIIHERGYTMSPSIDGYTGYAMVFYGGDVVSANR